MKVHGAEKIWVDHAKTNELKPQRARMMRTLRKGDELYVYSLFHLYTNEKEGIAILSELKRKSVRLFDLDEEVDLDHIKWWIKWKEDKNKAQTIDANIAVKSRPGQGKPALPNKSNREKLKAAFALLDAGKYPEEVAQILGVSKTTVYRWQQNREKYLAGKVRKIKCKSCQQLVGEKFEASPCPKCESHLGYEPAYYDKRGRKIEEK